MKTIEEMYKEINASDELKKAIAEIKDMASLEAFLKGKGCETTADELAKFIESQCEGELGDDMAAAAAGGYRAPDWRRFLPKDKRADRRNDWI